MNFISAFCFSINLFIIASCFKKGADPFSPGRVFGFVWALSIGLMELKQSFLQHEWSTYSWIIFLLGILSFLFGIWTINVLYVGMPLLTIGEIRRKLELEARSNLSEIRLFRIIWMLFIAYIVAYSIEVAIIGNVPLFSPRIEYARIHFGVFGFHLVVDAMLSILILLIEYFLLVENQLSHKLSLLFVFALTVGTFFLLLQRYNFFVWAVVALGMVYYFSRYLNIRNSIIVGAIFFGMLVWIQSLRVSQYVEHYHYVVSGMKYRPVYASLTEPYMYIVMNLENFARAVDKLDRYYFGYFTSDWLLALVGLKHWLKSYYNIQTLPYLISGYNTFTFHWWYYYDFGVFGVTIFSFLEGLVIAIVYCRLRTSPSVLIVLLYSFALLLMVISFIMNPLNRLDFVSNVILIWIVHRISFKRGEMVLIKSVMA